jgi:hypothetical protein
VGTTEVPKTVPSMGWNMSPLPHSYIAFLSLLTQNVTLFGNRIIKDTTNKDEVILESALIQYNGCFNEKGQT